LNSSNEQHAGRRWFAGEDERAAFAARAAEMKVGGITFARNQAWLF